MKLFYITNGRFPSERAHMIQIVHTCAALSEAGAEVTLAVTDRPTSITVPAEEYYGRKLDFPIVRLHVPDFAGRFGGLPFPINALFYSVQRLFFVIAVSRYLSKNNADIIYGRDEWILWLLSFKVHPRRLVYESHEAKRSLPARRLLANRVKCVVISEGIFEEYLSMGVPKEQLLIAHDAIDESFFGRLETIHESRKRLKLSDETRPIAMYIGGFEKWKGVDTFCQAAEILPGVAFVVIGGKDSEVAIYKERYKSVKFIGERPYKELQNNQQAADVLVIPNSQMTAISSLYTSPLKLFAHLTSKVPLVLSDVPSLRAVVNDSIAFFFTPDRPEALSAAIEKVLADVVGAEKRAINAFMLSRQFTWSARAKAILKFIQ